MLAILSLQFMLKWSIMITDCFEKKCVFKTLKSIWNWILNLQIPRGKRLKLMQSTCSLSRFKKFENKMIQTCFYIEAQAIVVFLTGTEPF